MIRFLAFSICLLLSSCSGHRRVSFEDVLLEDVDGATVNLQSVSGKGPLVLIFMSPDCPLCVNYTRTITELQSEFKNDSVSFFSVFPGTFYSREEIRKFYSAYGMDVTGLLDPERIITRSLKATVTPEAFVINTEGEILYSGAIDNWMYETGKKRAKITRFYLKEAISNVLNHQVPDPSHTEPVGCYIE